MEESEKPQKNVENKSNKEGDTENIVTEDEGDNVVEGEVELLSEKEGDASPASLKIYQQFASYTDAPEKLLQVLEDNDKGFIKKLNKLTLASLETDNPARQLFAKRQAYTSLVIGVFSAIAVLALPFYLIYKTGSAGFLSLIGIGCLYAITQSGFDGLGGIARAVGDAIHKLTKRRKTDEDQ